MIRKITGGKLNIAEKICRKIGQNAEQVSAKGSDIKTENIRIDFERSPKEDFIIIDLKPRNKFEAQARKLLTSPKNIDASGFPYSLEEINMVLKKTPINKKEDIELLKTLLNPDSPKFSVEEISLIINHKNTKPIPYPSEWCESFANGLKSGIDSVDIVIGSKIRALGCLIGQNIKDPVIGKAVMERLTKLRGNELNYYELNEELNSLINLVNIDSSARNFSYPLTGDSYKYTSLKKNYPEHNQVLNEIPQTPINQKSSDYEARLFQNEMKLDPLKSYLADNAKSDPELSKYLYETYYLPRLSTKTKEICQKISDEFGTKLFVENESSSKTAKMVYEELSEWKSVSKGEFLSPPVIDLSRYNPHYITSYNSAAYMSGKNNSVHVKGDVSENINLYLRHELAHVNDKYFESSGVLNGVDIDKIIVREPERADGTAGDLIWNKCLYKEEFANAGLDYDKIRYAYKNKREFIAVAAEGYYSKYSPEFKEVLVKLGMPEYVFKMEPCNTKFVANASQIEQTRRQYPKAKIVPF